ncbi:MAG: glutathionylspermidine synthase family protein [Alphaproteobacteria bacterium]|nr:glutathionylspermidine synthase family protein [Alphaproteobacteria bacterium]
MRRVATKPRANWIGRVEALGFDFHTIESTPYWDERAYYEFTAAEIDQIEDAADSLHRLSLQAVQHIVDDRLYALLGIQPAAAKLVEESWQRRDPSLYGRFDLAYRGDGPPKLLEYNADTPTSLFESAVIQWQWLEDTAPGADQFNSIHEALVERWRTIQAGADNFGELHLASVAPHPEDEGTVRYLQATAIESDLKTKVLAIQDLGWNGTGFTDLENVRVGHLFKLYPWEWLVKESFAGHIGPSGMVMIEPAWKMLLSNKGLLAVLWDLFPEHPNLLPAAFDRAAVPGDMVVRKPIFGREGANITIERSGEIIAQADGPYGDAGYVYQAYTPLAEDGGNYAVLGAWMVGDKCHGMGIREDDTLITRNTSRFVPHLFR